MFYLIILITKIMLESKLDNSFPDGQFLIDKYATSLSWLEKSFADIILLIPTGVSAKITLVSPSNINLVFCHLSSSFQIFLCRIHFLKQKMIMKLWNCCYNSKSNNIGSNQDCICRVMEPYFSMYDNVILLGDFDQSVMDFWTKEFCKTFNYAAVFPKSGNF